MAASAVCQMWHCMTSELEGHQARERRPSALTSHSAISSIGRVPTYNN